MADKILSPGNPLGKKLYYLRYSPDDYPLRRFIPFWSRPFRTRHHGGQNYPFVTLVFHHKHCSFGQKKNRYFALRVPVRNDRRNLLSPVVSFFYSLLPQQPAGAVRAL